MTNKHLLESAELLSQTVNADGTWRVRLISEGVGSTGVYSRELLERHFGAFDGSLSFTNHPMIAPQERDFTKIVGRVQGETWIEEDEDGNLGVYANYLPDPDYKPRLEMYKDKLGLSIFIEGEGSEDVNGNFLVESFNGDDPYKSVDVVIAAGRGGRFEESLQKTYTQRIESLGVQKPGATSAQDQTKDTETMTPEQLEELKNHMSALVAAKFDSLAEAKEEENVEQISVEEALVAYAEKLTAIDEADLFAKQAEALKARAAKGEDITEALEEAKTIRDEAKAAAVAESQNQSGGRVLGESTGFAGATAWGNR